jgi:hypothetical protein
VGERGAEVKFRSGRRWAPTSSASLVIIVAGTPVIVVIIVPENGIIVGPRRGLSAADGGP